MDVDGVAELTLRLGVDHLDDACGLADCHGFAVPPHVDRGRLALRPASRAARAVVPTRLDVGPS